jgi:hypothetical protein
MIDGSWMNNVDKEKYRKCGQTCSWCRGVVQPACRRIRHMFKWAVDNELVSATVLQVLQAFRVVRPFWTTITVLLEWQSGTRPHSPFKNCR